MSVLSAHRWAVCMLNHCLFSIDPALLTVYTAVLFVSMRVSSQIAVAESDTSFMAAFLSSISMIFVSEIGDKTFFIAGTSSHQLATKPVSYVRPWYAPGPGCLFSVV